MPKMSSGGGIVMVVQADSRLPSGLVKDKCRRISSGEVDSLSDREQDESHAKRESKDKGALFIAA